jgi:hypothetical protein
MPFTINGTTGIDLGTQPLTGSLPDANAPVGSVIQVVQGTYTTQQSTTSTSFVASGVAASITPSSSSNKVLVEVSMNGVTTTGGCFYTIYRDATNLGSGSNSCFAVVSASAGDAPLSMRFLDSPATTSSTTYTVYYKVNTGTGYTTPQGVSIVTLSEIAG